VRAKQKRSGANKRGKVATLWQGRTARPLVVQIIPLHVQQREIIESSAFELAKNYSASVFIVAA
jgi:hypothetical protein